MKRNVRVFSRIQLLRSLVPMRVDAHTATKTSKNNCSQRFSRAPFRYVDIAFVKFIGQDLVKDKKDLITFIRMDTYEIIAYEDCYKEVFRDLNAEWLNKYNLMESHDLEILNDPQKYILDAGGIIYLAKFNNEIVGSAAIIKEPNNVYELAKMSVAKNFRGKGISKILIEKCISKAMELKADKIILFSNSQLKTAISLYEKYGFRHVTVEDSPFLTADVKMELRL
jgi:GNAT superfamily N-acetyltransferase